MRGLRVLTDCSVTGSDVISAEIATYPAIFAKCQHTYTRARTRARARTHAHTHMHAHTLTDSCTHERAHAHAQTLYYAITSITTKNTAQNG